MPAEPAVKRTIAFFISPTYSNTQGIDKTDWLRIDCKICSVSLDRRDYRPNGTNP